MGAVGHAVQVGLARHHAEGVHVRRRCAATQRRHRRALPPAGARVVHEPERRVLAHALHAAQTSGSYEAAEKKFLLADRSQTAASARDSIIVAQN